MSVVDDHAPSTIPRSHVRLTMPRNRVWGSASTLLGASPTSLSLRPRFNCHLQRFSCLLACIALSTSTLPRSDLGVSASNVTKMDQEHEQTLAEQEALLAECKLYQGEKEPETKEPLTQEDEEETVTGLPVGPTPTSTDVGVPVPRTPWSTGFFQCFGTGDEHFSSDLEVCVLGAAAPCVLYGSNMERLYPRSGLFADRCLRYSFLLFLGQLLFNANNMAPWSSVGSRVEIRRKYNLEGYGKYCFGCSGTPGEESRDRCDSMCDVLIHGLFCLHPFALAQEGRELRRRTLHPAFQPYLVVTMAPPMEQSMNS